MSDAKPATPRTIRDCVREIEGCDLAMHDLDEACRVDGLRTPSVEDSRKAYELAKQRNDLVEELTKLLDEIAPARLLPRQPFYANDDGEVTFDRDDRREQFRVMREIGAVTNVGRNGPRLVPAKIVVLPFRPRMTEEL